MNTDEKLRRRVVDDRVREFRDAADFIASHPLLLWAPHVEPAAKKLLLAITKIRKRTQANRRHDK
jgi:hypothetical protein